MPQRWLAALVAALALNALATGATAWFLHSHIEREAARRSDATVTSMAADTLKQPYEIPATMAEIDRLDRRMTDIEGSLVYGEYWNKPVSPE